MMVAGYELGPLLRVGPAGSVHRGKDRRGAAVTVQLVPVGADRRAMQWVREWAGTLTGLGHPGVLAPREVVAWASGVMAVFDGPPRKTLAATLAGRGRLPALVVATGGASAADALEALHGIGLVHGDLTPASILTGAAGPPVLADAGLSLWLADPDRWGGVVVGTAGYLDPEVAAGAAPGPASDIYALGAVCWEALVGYPPYGGTGALATLRAAERGRLPRLASLGSDVPTALATVVSAALARRAADRPGSAAELAAELLGAGTPRRATGTLGATTGSAPRRAPALLVTAAPAPAGPSLTGPDGPAPAAPDDPPLTGAGHTAPATWTAGLGPRPLRTGRSPFPVPGPPDEDHPYRPERVPRRRALRRRPVTLVAGAGVALVAALGGIAQLGGGPASPGRGPAVALRRSAATSGETGPRLASTPPPPPPQPHRPSPAGPIARRPAPRCGPVPAPAPAEQLEVDVAGRGCARLTWAGGVLTVDQGPAFGQERFSLGQPGDELLVGRWGCGSQTVALYRPATGQVFTWAGWAAPGRPLAAATAVATGVVGGDPVGVPTGRGRCARVVVLPAGGPTGSNAVHGSP